MNDTERMFACHATAFADVHGSTDSRRLVANLETRVTLLQEDELLMPATINDGAATGRNAWICSPLTTYCHYAIEELERYLHPILARPLRLVCKAYGYLMKRARIDRAVTVNNWLLSTNLYPPLRADALLRMIESVTMAWPDHAIWFRSLNTEQNADWMALLRSRGFDLIPSRQVYLFDAPSAQGAQRADLKRDMRLLRTTRLQRVGPDDFRGGDFVRIAELYADLYIAKYSRLNPQYTTQFFQSWHGAGLVQLHGFKDADGILQGVVGLFCHGGTITAPIVGYNTVLPVQLGLYRLLMACVFDEAARAGAAVNLSAGAAEFKRLRGGRPVIEYSAVLTKHLPVYPRGVIAVLRALTTSIGVPLMKRYEL
jgi:hypothetical protein